MHPVNQIAASGEIITDENHHLEMSLSESRLVAVEAVEAVGEIVRIFHQDQYAFFFNR